MDKDIYTLNNTTCKYTQKISSENQIIQCISKGGNTAMNLKNQKKFIIYRIYTSRWNSVWEGKIVLDEFCVWYKSSKRRVFRLRFIRLLFRM